MNAEQSEIFRRDGEINYSVQSRSGTRYRANAYHSQGSAGLVLRRINHVIPQMQELGLPEKLKDLAVAPRGLLIIVGPTGSGKSTTIRPQTRQNGQDGGCRLAHQHARHPRLHPEGRPDEHQ